MFFASCRPTTLTKDSGIADELYEASWFENSNSIYHASSHLNHGDCTGKTLDGVETERRFVITLGSGSVGELIPIFQNEVKKMVEKSGAKIWDSTTIEATKNDGLTDFSYDYIWQDNVGIIRAHSVVSPSNTVTVILLCYEHRR